MGRGRVAAQTVPIHQVGTCRSSTSHSAWAAGEGGQCPRSPGPEGTLEEGSPEGEDGRAEASCRSLCRGSGAARRLYLGEQSAGPRVWDRRGLEPLHGTPGPCGGPTSWPRGFPMSHGHNPQGQALQAQPQPQPQLLPWDGDREPDSPEAMVVRLEKSVVATDRARSCRQGPQHCPEARGNRRSPHHPQKLRDTFRAIKRFTGKSCLSPSQEVGQQARPPWAQRERLPGTKGTLSCHPRLAAAQPRATGHSH